MGRGSGDGGIDVLVPGVLVAQVKAQASKVGRPPLQQIAGVASADGVRATCFSKSGYTKGALEWADRASVALFTVVVRDDRFVIAPVNRHGHGTS